MQASNNKLSGIETKIATTIKNSRQEAVSLLERVVNINSGTMNFEGVKQVGDIFAEELKSLGFNTQWVDGKAFNRAGHLLANIGKDKADTTKILLIGHLDTVFSKQSKFQKFRPIDDRYTAGPGITDMKGGDIIIISALRALKVNGLLNKMAITVIMTGDEEKRGSPYDVSAKSLVDAGKWADVALGFEDGDGNPKTAVISRRGAAGWKLEVTGRPAHSSQIFREGYGYGAIFETARILNSFREKLSTVDNLTFNPGVIVGGTRAELDPSAVSGNAFGKDNVIAGKVIVKGDLRAITPKQLEESRSIMRKIVANNLDLTSAKIHFHDGYPPMPPSANNRKLLKIYDAISQQLNYGSVQAVDPRKAGAADISFVANYVDMAMDGLGLMGPGGHTVKEKADMNTLTSQTQRAAILMYRLSNN